METTSYEEPVLVVYSQPALIVEDDKHIRNVLAETLRGMGLEVEALPLANWPWPGPANRHFAWRCGSQLAGHQGNRNLAPARAIDASLPVVMMTAYHTTIRFSRPGPRGRSIFFASRFCRTTSVSRWHGN